MKKIFNLLAAAACVLSLQATTVTVTPNGSVCSVTVDGTTYDNVPVTVQEGINLAVVNRDGVSLLVRYTDANTVAVNGTVNGEPVDYASNAVAAYAKTFQIPNSDFETWSTDNDITEPRYWHGFKSATGNLASQATSTLLKSNDVRTGASGSSAVIASKSIYGVVANGTMTNGRLMAQSMTASNTWNHSEMDQNSTATDKWGDKFYTALNAKPDAIKTWLKFTQGTTNAQYPYATLSAILFDGDKYQDPEPKKGDSSSIIGGTKYTQDDADYAAARVAAKAQNKQIATGGWRELSIPFNYTDANKAKAILVTISTNATPGKGSANDQVWVDDMELVYNAGINNIALNGVTLEGFAFDAATKTYDLSYSGVALSLTADNFDVTADGQSAMVVKNVENLGGGNYRVVIAVTSPDFKNYDLYTINVNFNPITGKVYILGDVNGIGWHANNGVEMSTEDQKIYTAQVTTAGETHGFSYFYFTTELANDDDQGAWNYILPYSFGYNYEPGFPESYIISGNALNHPQHLGEFGTTGKYGLEAGQWNFTLDMEARTLTVTKAANPGLRGDINGDGKVDVTDVNVVVNIILGKDSKDNYPNADTDGNGTVDVTDVNAVVNIILGKN